MPGKNDQWEKYKETILAKLTHKEVYGQIKNQKQGSDDWMTGLCPFHKDSHNSFVFNTRTLSFCCFAGCGKGSALDFIMLTGGRGFKDTLVELGDKLGVPKPQAKPKRPPIQEQLVKNWQANLNPQLTAYLKEQRGLTEETIKKYQIGWEVKRQRYTIPIRDERGNLVNIRLYNGKKDPKIINYTEGKHKYGSPARLYGLDELVKYQGKQTIICEGELDRLLLQQEGFMAVTGTHGCSTFRPEWVNYFAGKDVVIIFDCDKEGQAAVSNIIYKAFKNSKINSIKNVLLPLKGDKNDKDISDYFQKHGFTGTELQKLIDETPPHKYQQEAAIEEAIKLNSFTKIEQKEYIDKRIQCEITACGETSEAFHAVEEFRVTYCNKLHKGECFECAEPIKIPKSAQEYIGSCMSTNVQLKAMLREYCCKYGQKPTIEILRRTTIKEFFCHQRVNRIIHVKDKDNPNRFIDSHNRELMEKRVYYISSQDVRPGNYLATGYVKSHPKTQMVTFLIDTLIPQEDDFQAFRLEDNLEHLRTLKNFTMHEIISDLTKNVTHIFHRDQMIMAILLTFLSPRRITFNYESIRGWLITVIIGDTGEGKSTTYTKLAEFLDLGDIFSGLTGTRTGLAYALVEHKQKGWQVKIGRYPANNGKILCVDEVQNIRQQELLPLAKAMDEGFLQIDRVLSKGYECETRMLLLGNPKPRRQGAPNEKKETHQVMDEFTFGCLALKDIFPYQFLRRIDIAVIVNNNDPRKKHNSSFYLPMHEGKITRKMLKSLIFWAWNLREDRIDFEPAVQEHCIDQAEKLGEKFGNASDIPLVCKSDIKNNLARISAATAVLCLSEKDNFSRLVIKKEHVDGAVEFLNFIYAHDNFQLEDYSEYQKMRHQLHDYDKAKNEFLDIAGREKHDPQGKASFRKMVKYLRYLNNVRRSDLADMVGCGTDRISDMVRILKRYEFIDSTKDGYSKRPKFNRFLRRFSRECPDFLSVSI